VAQTSASLSMLRDMTIQRVDNVAIVVVLADQIG
jgi:hypothetical protein